MMPTSRIAIVNGKIAGEPEVEAALEELRSRGPVRVRVTGAPGDAHRFAVEAAEAVADQVLVFGGDGTLSTVAAGLVSGGAARPFGGALGVIPTGTANDFATCAGITGASPSEAVAELDAYEPVTLDLGGVAGGGGRTFLNVATAGFGAEVSSEASEELKAVLGRVSYLVAGIASAGEISPRHATVTAPGFERRVAFYLLAVGNARCAGGGMPICPRADPTDGLFDVTIVPEGTVGATLAEIIRTGVQGVGDAGISFRAPWLEVHGDEPLQINLDGEPASGTRFRFEVRPRLLRVLLPVDSPLLRPPEEAADEAEERST